MSIKIEMYMLVGRKYLKEYLLKAHLLNSLKIVVVCIGVVSKKINFG